MNHTCLFHTHKHIFMASFNVFSFNFTCVHMYFLLLITCIKYRSFCDLIFTRIRMSLPTFFVRQMFQEPIKISTHLTIRLIFCLRLKAKHRYLLNDKHFPFLYSIFLFTNWYNSNVGTCLNCPKSF